MVATLRHEKKTIKTLSVLGRLVAGAGFEFYQRQFLSW